MGVIAPERRHGRAYFGCGAAACLGLIFWAIISCCLVFTVAGISTEAVFLPLSAGMLLAAALPTVVLETPGMAVWLKAAGILVGLAYLLYGMLMLWLALTAYASYRYAGDGA